MKQCQLIKEKSPIHKILVDSWAKGVEEHAVVGGGDGGEKSIMCAGFLYFYFQPKSKMSLHSVFSNEIYSSLPGVRRLWHRKGRPEH